MTIETWDNTGGQDPDVKPSWWQAAADWPIGPFDGMPYRDGDPLHTLAAALKAPQRDGYVLVKVEEIKAVLNRRTCRSTHVFDRDEDGPMAPRTFHCIYEAGHRGHHGNGYYNWAPQRTGGDSDQSD